MEPRLRVALLGGLVAFLALVALLFALTGWRAAVDADACEEDGGSDCADLSGGWLTSAAATGAVAGLLGRLTYLVIHDRTDPVRAGRVVGVVGALIMGAAWAASAAPCAPGTTFIGMLGCASASIAVMGLGGGVIAAGWVLTGVRSQALGRTME